MRADGALGSTGGSALDYDPGMRKAGLVVPVLFALVVDVSACNEPEPENVPGEFGQPCVAGAAIGSPDGCEDGLDCFAGYCEESCFQDSDCRAIDGWDHVCAAGLCQILCSAEQTCPDSLETTLECKGHSCSAVPE